ncbi:MAG: methyltransferase domain-containing protein [Planctomycetaceae bacterium]|nr:methyltransferase domain-containing protein [Planctomycetaceae bacterium]
MQTRPPLKNVSSAEPQWHKRMEEIDSPVDSITLPAADGEGCAQDREWCEARIDGERRRYRFHDYDQIFKVPGLYEEIFYNTLECCSPSRVASLLEELLEDFKVSPGSLRVIDVGAGNGMVGDELQARGVVDELVGLDIIPEAREAAERDRPDLYDDYIVADLTNLPPAAEDKLRKRKFNCLTSVAALGFGDIPALAFARALDLVDEPGWVAFTIKEDFLREEETSGFARLIRRLTNTGVLEMQAYRRFRHRLAVSGEALYYVAMIARKAKPVPGDALRDPN